MTSALGTGGLSSLVRLLATAPAPPVPAWGSPTWGHHNLTRHSFCVECGRPLLKSAANGH